MKTGRLVQAEQANRQAQELCKQLAEEYPTVVEYRRLLAMCHASLGGVLYKMGRTAEAEPAMRQALDAGRDLARAFPAVPEYRDDLANHHHNLGALLEVTGRFVQAESEYRQALDLRRRLVQDFPTVREYRESQAVALENLGALLGKAGRLAQAEQAYRQAIEVRTKLASDFPSVPAYRQALAQIYNRLGLLRMRSGRLADAEVAYRQALELVRKLVADFPRDRNNRYELALSYEKLGEHLQATGEYGEAEQAYRQAIEGFEKLVAEFPGVPEYRQNLAMSHSDLGLVRDATGRRVEAEQSCREALALRRKLVADFPNMPAHRDDLAASHNNLGLLLTKAGRPAEAEQEYRQAVQVGMKLVAEFPAVPEYRHTLAGSYTNFANQLIGKGRVGEAEQAHRQAHELRKKLVQDFPDVADYAVGLACTCGNFGDLARNQGQLAAALDWYATAIRTLTPVLAKDARSATARRFLRNSYLGRAWVLERLGRYREALADLDRMAKLDHRNNPNLRQAGVANLQSLTDLARGYLYVGVGLMKTGDLAEAERCFRQALVRTKRLAEAFPEVAELRDGLVTSHQNLAVVVGEAGRSKEAEAVHRQAHQLATALVRDFPNRPEYAVRLGRICCNFGHLMNGQGQPAAALTWYDQAIRTLKPVLHKAPQHSKARQCLRIAHEGRAQTLIHLGEHARAAADLKEIAKIQGLAPDDCYNLACLNALCSAAAGKDQKLPAAQRTKLAEDYAHEALRLLRDAIARGYQDVAHLKKDPDFDALRAREDFQKLVRELEAKVKPGKKP